ncbi:MAG: hypothetical protein COB29_12970 [Sulfitobacter sp.]|nr:MAG: hypothetical protein COB29_12970 [Sulfitobacter sp.]
MGLTQIASRLIKKHGQAATLLRPSEGTYDEYGGYIPGVDTEHPVTLVSATYAIELQVWAGGLVAVGDQRVLVSVEGFALKPETTDRLRIDGDIFRTIGVSPLAPAGEVIFWEMQVRND